VTRLLVTTPERRRIMAAVPQAGTTPELLVRQVLSRLGLRYRLNVQGLPGRPDIANRRRLLAVFVHGCFWHRHEGCQLATTPKRNRQFWTKKFAANCVRDARNSAALRRRGYSVVVVWECETRKLLKLESRLRRLVQELG
jgi:DNA mismatch endonuclease, patch repair protein